MESPQPNRGGEYGKKTKKDVFLTMFRGVSGHFLRFFREISRSPGFSSDSPDFRSTLFAEFRYFRCVSPNFALFDCFFAEFLCLRSVSLDLRIFASDLFRSFPSDFSDFSVGFFRYFESGFFKIFVFLVGFSLFEVSLLTKLRGKPRKVDFRGKAPKRVEN